MTDMSRSFPKPEAELPLTADMTSVRLGPPVAEGSCMRIAHVFVAVAILARASTVLASPRVAVLEPEVAPPGVAAPEQPQPPPPIAALDLAQQRDAASDRGFLVGSAITIPQGKVEASVRYATGEITGTMINGGAGLSRDFEVSADLAQSFKSWSRTYGLGGKLVAIRRASWALAFEAGYRHIYDGSGTASDYHSYYTAGARITGCFDGACSILGTFGVAGIGMETVVIDGGGATRLLVLPVLSGSVTFGTGIARPFVEGVVSFGALGIMGVRFAWKSAAIDLGVGGGAVAGSGGTASANALVGITFRP
jgi:hypothetical protein